MSAVLVRSTDLGPCSCCPAVGGCQCLTLTIDPPLPDPAATDPAVAFGPYLRFLAGSIRLSTCDGRTADESGNPVTVSYGGFLPVRLWWGMYSSWYDLLVKLYVEYHAAPFTTRYSYFPEAVDHPAGWYIVQDPNSSAGFKSPEFNSCALADSGYASVSYPAPEPTPVALTARAGGTPFTTSAVPSGSMTGMYLWDYLCPGYYVDPDSYGPWSSSFPFSLAANDSCAAPTPPPVPPLYDCVNGGCLPGHKGHYLTLADCRTGPDGSARCGPPPPVSYNCVAGNCQDPGDGTGRYATVAACQADGCGTTYYCVGVAGTSIPAVPTSCLQSATYPSNSYVVYGTYPTAAACSAAGCGANCGINTGTPFTDGSGGYSVVVTVSGYPGTVYMLSVYRGAAGGGYSETGSTTVTIGGDGGSQAILPLGPVSSSSYSPGYYAMATNGNGIPCGTYSGTVS